MQRSPAFFDVKKLTHMNGVYIRDLPVDDFVAAIAPVGRPGAGGVGAGRLARPRHRGARDGVGPPWPPERFDPDGLRRAGRGRRRSG